MNTEETKRLLRVLGAAYQGTTVDDDVIAVWSSRLEYHDFDTVMAEAIAWVDNERHFPRISDFIDRVEERARRGAARHALQAAPCNCDGGFVMVNAEERRVRPCQRCNPVAYMRWSDGHFEPNHSCGDCEDIKKGRRAS